MATKLVWQSAALTHAGRVREVNEDACLALPTCGVWAVADGMGGHDAGDIASRMIVDTLSRLIPTNTLSAMVDAIEERLLDVNRRLRQIAAESTRILGSTVAVLATRDDRAVCLWAGDSRVYCGRGNELSRLTEDHVPGGGPASRTNVITRAVGACDTLELDMELYDAAPGDRWLLCSDGLYKSMADADIEETLTKGDAKTACSALIGRALDRGARDNVTAVVAQVLHA